MLIQNLTLCNLQKNRYIRFMFVYLKAKVCLLEIIIQIFAQQKTNKILTMKLHINLVLIISILIQNIS